MTIPLLELWCGALEDDSFKSAASRARMLDEASSASAVSSNIDRGRIDRLRAGDVAELESLFREMAPALCRFAERLGNTREESDDIVADVFFMLWERRATLDVVLQLRPYLFATVRHLALNSRRSAHRAAVRESSAMREWVSDAGDRTLEHPIEQDDIATRVWREVLALPEVQRSAVELRFAHELSLAQVATVLGVSTPAVKMLLQRAIRTLKKRLGGLFESL